MSGASTQTFLVCGRCGIATTHTLLCTTDSDNEYLDADGYKGIEPATYRVFRCDGCTQVSVYIWSALHSPRSQFGEQHYPADSVDIPGAPTNVRVAYKQAAKVKPHSKVAYVVLARRVLDAIVQDRCPKERNLSLALKSLEAKGDIPPMLAEAANHIRLFGNVAAHEADKNLNEIHVQMIEKFLDVVVEYLYITPSALHEFKVLLDLESKETSDA